MTQPSDPLPCYNLAHEPIGALDAAMLMGDPRCRVGETTFEGHRISTVFLVTDHSHGHGHGSVPVLYETMVFNPDGDIVWCERYATRDAALAGHDRAQAWLRSPSVAGAPRTPRTPRTP